MHAPNCMFAAITTSVSAAGAAVCSTVRYTSAAKVHLASNCNARAYAMRRGATTATRAWRASCIESTRLVSNARTLLPESIAEIDSRTQRRPHESNDTALPPSITQSSNKRSVKSPALVVRHSAHVSLSQRASASKNA